MTTLIPAAAPLSGQTSDGPPLTAARLPGRRRTLPRIDSAVAVVNLVLLLLFFFMAAGQSRHDEGGVTPARTAALPLERLPSPLLVVAADGGWTLDGQPVAADLLAAALPPDPRGTTLHLLIDRQAPARQLIETLAHPALSNYRLRLVTIRGTGEG